LVQRVAPEGFAVGPDEDTFRTGVVLQVLAQERDHVGRNGDPASACPALGALVLADGCLQEFKPSRLHVDDALVEVDVLTA
jgi:hypothetical protein